MSVTLTVSPRCHGCGRRLRSEWSVVVEGGLEFCSIEHAIEWAERWEAVELLEVLKRFQRWNEGRK